MSVPFRVGRYIAPSGFALAVVDIPALDPEKNISLIDYSHQWEENVASAEQSLYGSYVDSGGHMSKMTVTEFLVTNTTTTASNDVVAAPLWYRHRCRFHHYTFGENPSRQVYITDVNGNILKETNYAIRSYRVASNVYKIDVVTDFQNNESSRYRVKYNRCTIGGTSLYPGWTENLNATPYFTEGSPLLRTDEYSLDGPDGNGLYNAVVPPVPTLSGLINGIGVSFENSPTILEQDVTNLLVSYDVGVTVRYTLKALSESTFTLQRSQTRTGAVSNEYLQVATSDSWAVSPPGTALTTGVTITALYAMKLFIHGDNALKAGDEAYFTAQRSFYYLMPTAYSAIYMQKPTNVTPDDDWYIRVKNGRFRRWVDETGEVVPSGVGTLWEYGVPEYMNQMWDLSYGPPYKKSLNERVELLDRQTIQLEHTPLFIEPSDVLYYSDAPGFAPTGYLSVVVNDEPVPATGVVDWDLYNGEVKLAQLLTHKDDITATYIYEEDFYSYDGFIGSGAPYPTDPPFPFFQLDVNPTPDHNYGLYASGTIAHLYLRPYINMNTLTQVCNEALYHNFTGTPSGVFDFHVGSISVGPHCKITDINVTDVRRRGGGLSQKGIDAIEDVKDLNPETEFFWDVGYFDGKAVPANGVIVVRVPKAILQSNGGVFTEDEIRQRVLKHMAIGEYPIIEYV